jgi:putative ABC transport system substrate-binding protein
MTVGRREFITLLGGAATWPLAARAQQSKMPVIGYLGATSPNLRPASEQLAVFRQGLREVGFVEGENVAVEYRWAEGKYDRLPLLAADLVRLQVAVICANGGTPTSLAAKAATQSIPIVFLIGTNPVEVGLVASLNRPGGNATGVTILNADLMAKRIEAIHEVVPAAGTIALLVNPASPPLSATEQSEAQFAARALALRLVVANASNPSDIESAFSKLSGEGAGGLVISSDVFLFSRHEQIIEGAHRHGIPTLYPYRLYVAAGGLMSYAASEFDAMRQVAIYTGRVLKGEKPADLPVQQAAKVELVINLKTARALGLEVPPTLLARADEVIE